MSLLENIKDDGKKRYSLPDKKPYGRLTVKYVNRKRRDHDHKMKMICVYSDMDVCRKITYYFKEHKKKRKRKNELDRMIHRKKKNQKLLQFFTKE